MLSWLPHFAFNETNITVAIIFAAVVLYESKFKEPITFILGEIKLFEGKTYERILRWLLFVYIILSFLWIF